MGNERLHIFHSVGDVAPAFAGNHHLAAKLFILFEQQHLGAVFRRRAGRHTARRAAADHNNPITLHVPGNPPLFHRPGTRPKCALTY